MFQSGNFVADYVTEMDGSDVSDEAVQTHGVELGIDEIYRLNGPSFISNESYSKPDRSEISVRDNENLNLRDEHDGKEVVKGSHYELIRGNYVVKYDKKVKIPDDTVAFVFPRSRLMRSGIEVTTAVWESGYEGEGEGGLYVDNQAFIQEDTRIAQMVMCRADVLLQYSGSHQHENLKEFQ